MALEDIPINMTLGDYFNGKCLRCNIGSVYLIKADNNTYWGQCNNRDCGHRVPLGDGPEYAKGHMETLTVNGYKIAGNAHLAIAINTENPEDAHSFTPDEHEPFLNAFDCAVRWTSPGL